MVNVPPMDKFAITVIGKTILRSALHEFEKPKLNHVLLTNTSFSLIREIFKETLKNLADISQIKNEPSDWNITLSSNSTPISYKIDTGFQFNVIPVESLENISPKSDLQPLNIKPSAYNGSKIPVVGKCSLSLAHKNNSFNASFIAVDSDSVPIFRLKTSKHLQLIKRICRIETNK